MLLERDILGVPLEIGATTLVRGALLEEGWRGRVGEGS